MSYKSHVIQEQSGLKGECTETCRECTASEGSASLPCPVRGLVTLIRQSVAGCNCCIVCGVDDAEILVRLGAQQLTQRCCHLLDKFAACLQSAARHAEGFKFRSFAVHRYGAGSNLNKADCHCRSQLPVYACCCMVATWTASGPTKLIRDDRKGL